MKLSKRQWTIATLISLAVLVITIVVAVTVDWSTIRRYTNEEGQYRLRFPLTWSLHVEKVKVRGRNEYRPVRNIIELDAPGKPKPYILISYSRGLEPQQVLDYVRNSSECDEITSGDGEEIMVAGMEGLIFRDTKCNSPGETRVYAMNGGMGYSFIFSGSPADEEVINLIINNFSLIP